MRPMTPAQAVKAVELTARYSRVHGAPIHVGNPVEYVTKMSLIIIMMLFYMSFRKD